MPNKVLSSLNYTETLLKSCVTLFKPGQPKPNPLFSPKFWGPKTPLTIHVSLNEIKKSALVSFRFFLLRIQNYYPLSIK